MATAGHFLFERLQQSPVEFIAHNVLGDNQAVIDFTGHFEGHPQLWHATVIALKTEEKVSKPQYIDVSESTRVQQPLDVEIGLQVGRIEESTVLMVIKMIRQWKNLRRGRHEFLGAAK